MPNILTWYCFSLMKMHPSDDRSLIAREQAWAAGWLDVRVQ
jgi:hypothetical protein